MFYIKTDDGALLNLGQVKRIETATNNLVIDNIIIRKCDSPEAAQILLTKLGRMLGAADLPSVPVLVINDKLAEWSTMETPETPEADAPVLVPTPDAPTEGGAAEPVPTPDVTAENVVEEVPQEPTDEQPVPTE